MIELCPLCKRHPAIIRKRQTYNLRRGKPVECEEEYYFCSYRENDPDSAYFVTPQMMDKNLLRFMQAYETKYPMSEQDMEYKKKLEEDVRKYEQ